MLEFWCGVREAELLKDNTRMCNENYASCYVIELHQTGNISRQVST